MVRGPAPKETASRLRDERRKERDRVSLTEDGRVRGPALPEGTDWHPATLQWWGDIRRSPVAQVLTAVDWDFLLDTAVLHSAFWSGDHKVAAELRLRVAKFGMSSPEDRLRLRLT